MFKESSTPKIQPEGKGAAVIKPRIVSVDILRGLIMVIMALDHVRDFFTNVRFDPLDLSQTSPELFLTRWITHFCAPVFVFLAGTGAFLSTTRGKTKKELSKFLWTRGLWLVLLELTFVRLGIMFNFDYSFLFGQVIWVIGLSMIALSGLIYLSLRSIAVFGIGLVLIHNVFDPLTPESFGVLSPLWKFLHEGGVVLWGEGNIFLFFYPFIPWVGVMAAGYALGSIMLLEEKKRNKILLKLGLGLTAGFIILRFTNLYGNPTEWTEQKNFIYTFLSFLNNEKYPPSLLFLLMTLGPSIVSLVLLEKAKGIIANFFLIFGRVPMFYYLIHFYVIHGLAVLIAYLEGMNPGFLTTNEIFNFPAEWGYSLAVVYGIWIGIIFLLYPVCLWYANLKKRKKSKILSYL